MAKPRTLSHPANANCAPRLVRLLTIIRLVRTGQARTTAQLTATLDVSRRTLCRDLEVLRTAGLAVEYHPGAGYQIETNGLI
jgi:predicted DNA-binding transcriptional regulator YafY